MEFTNNEIIENYVPTTEFEKAVVSSFKEIKKKIQPSPDPYEDYYTPAEVCNKLKISIRTFYSYVSEGILKTHKFSQKERRIFILKSDIEKLFIIKFPKPMSRESNLDKIRQGFKKATDFEITITIKGSLLVNNGLVEAWRELRGIDEGVLIDVDYRDTISIYQAEALGIIEKL